MKRIISAALSLCMIILTFAGCSSSGNVYYPLKVNGTNIEEEVFRYFLNEAFSDSEIQSKEDRITVATNLCIRYVAINSAYSAAGLSLTPAENVQTVNNANVLWNMFGEHYESIGVSKQTFVKIHYSDEYREKLRLSYFDKDGSDPVSDAALRGYLADNYVAFKLIRGYLFTTDVYGNTVDFTEDELLKMLERYENAADEINKGTSIEIMYSSLVDGAEDIQQSLKTEVIDSSDHNYPAGFYNTVLKLDNNEAGLCTFGDYIYLIYRVDILNDSAIFDTLRPECLKAVSEAPLTSKINALCSEYTSIRKIKLVEKYYKQINSVREK